MVRSFSVKSNDYMYVIYVSGLIRSILSLHDLINNKINAKDTELERAKREKEEEAEKRKKKEEQQKKLEEKKAAESESKTNWLHVPTLISINFL